MGLDPVSWALIAGGVGAGATLSSVAKKAPTAKTPGAPPAPVDAGEGAGKKRRVYRPAAQLFGDQDLRLGIGGKLGI